MPFSRNGDGDEAFSSRSEVVAQATNSWSSPPHGLYGTGLPPSLLLSGSCLTPGPWHEKEASSATTTKAHSPSTSSYAPVAPAPVDPKLERQRVGLKGEN